MANVLCILDRRPNKGFMHVHNELKAKWISEKNKNRYKCWAEDDSDIESSVTFQFSLENGVKIRLTEIVPIYPEVKHEISIKHMIGVINDPDFIPDKLIVHLSCLGRAKHPPSLYAIKNSSIDLNKVIIYTAVTSNDKSIREVLCNSVKESKIHTFRHIGELSEIVLLINDVVEEVTGGV